MARNLGMVTAYAYAVAGGYTGTEAEFEELLGNIADDLSQIENLSVTVTTLTPGSSATASYSNGVLALGIPRGNTGATGNGISAIIKTGTSGLVDTYTVTYTNGQTMTYTVTNGAKGDTGNGIASIALTSTSGAVKTYTVTFTDGSTFTFDVTDGEVTNASLAEAFEDFSANGTVANAEQLTTDIRANDQTPYLFRTAGGSVDIGDREYINGIVGGTVAWNQLIKEFSSTDWHAENDVSVSYSDGVATITNASSNNNGIYCACNLVAGHKYLTSCELNAADATTYTIGRGSSGVYCSKALSANSGFTTLAIVISCIAGGTVQMFVYGAGAYSNLKAKNFICVDLTLMFGSTIADYIYSLEQATAGAGVAFFKTLFPKPYYAYNAGELKSVKGLVSHDMVGFNAWDGENSATGKYLDSSGAETTNAQWNITDYIRVVPNTSYYFKNLNTTATSACICWYDADKNFISSNSILNSGFTVTSPTNACYLKCTYLATSASSVCINLSWDGSEDGNYEPYQKWSYPLDSDLELRGIPKIENGNLYYDGDVYEADGTVTRKYGIVDLGTISWNHASPTRSAGHIDGIKIPASTSLLADCITEKGYTQVIASSSLSANGEYAIANFGGTNNILFYYDGVTEPSGYLVYELATPTTETADPYTNPQIVNDFGTEEFVISNTVDVPIPVGHNTDYPVNLKAKVEMMPNSPDGDGDYIVRQTSGTNEYVSIADNATIQNILARLEALEG